MKRPLQPLYKDGEILRFEPNKIDLFLLDTSKFGLNELSLMPFEQKDWDQFYQLIGMSLCGYKESTMTSDSAVKEALKVAEKLK